MKTIILIIITSLVFFILGIGIGFLLRTDRKEKITPFIELNAQEKTIRELSKSIALDSICANFSGKILNIQNNIITIQHELNTFEIKVDPQAHIVRLSPSPQDNENIPTTEVIELNQINPGEEIIIYGIITQQGEIIARGITLIL